MIHFTVGNVTCTMKPNTFSVNLTLFYCQQHWYLKHISVLWILDTLLRYRRTKRPVGGAIMPLYVSGFPKYG